MKFKSILALLVIVFAGMQDCSAQFFKNLVTYDTMNFKQHNLSLLTGYNYSHFKGDKAISGSGFLLGHIGLRYLYGNKLMYSLQFTGFESEYSEGGNENFELEYRSFQMLNASFGYNLLYRKNNFKLIPKIQIMSVSGRLRAPLYGNILWEYPRSIYYEGLGLGLGLNSEVVILRHLVISTSIDYCWYNTEEYYFYSRLVSLDKLIRKPSLNFSASLGFQFGYDR